MLRIPKRRLRSPQKLVSGAGVNVHRKSRKWGRQRSYMQKLANTFSLELKLRKSSIYDLSINSLGSIRYSLTLVDLS